MYSGGSLRPDDPDEDSPKDCKLCLRSLMAKRAEGML
jgi:hypothetical protein